MELIGLNKKEIQQALKQKMKGLEKISFGGNPLTDKFLEKLGDKATSYVEDKQIDWSVLSYEDTEPQVSDDLPEFGYDTKSQMLVLEIQLYEVKPAVVYTTEVGGTNEDFEMEAEEIIDSHTVYVMMDGKLKIRNWSEREPNAMEYL